MKQLALFFSIVIFGIISLPFPSYGLHSEQVAYVSAVRGKVMAEDGKGQMRKLNMKGPIFVEDVITTGKNGRLQIIFTDNTIINLGRNSEMKLAEYEWDKARQKGGMKTKVKEGIFRVLGGAITKNSPENFSTETGIATIGIRGSMYAGKVDESSLSVVLLGGLGIYVTNSFGTVELDQSGWGTFVTSPELPPLPPKRFNLTELSVLEIKMEDKKPVKLKQPPAEKKAESDIAPSRQQDTTPQDQKQPQEPTEQPPPGEKQKLHAPVDQPPHPEDQGAPSGPEPMDDHWPGEHGQPMTEHPEEPGEPMGESQPWDPDMPMDEDREDQFAHIMPDGEPLEYYPPEEHERPKDEPPPWDPDMQYIDEPMMHDQQAPMEEYEPWFPDQHIEEHEPWSPDQQMGELDPWLPEEPHDEQDFVFYEDPIDPDRDFFEEIHYEEDFKELLMPPGFYTASLITWGSENPNENPSWWDELRHPDGGTIIIHQDGAVVGETIAHDYTSFFMELHIAPYNLEIPYDYQQIMGRGFLEVEPLLGEPWGFELQTWFSSLGEFVYFGNMDFTGLTEHHDFHYFGFLGYHSPPVQRHGIGVYQGHFLGNLATSQEFGAGFFNLDMNVNWDNSKVIGMLWDEAVQDDSLWAPLYFFGSLDQEHGNIIPDSTYLFSTGEQKNPYNAEEPVTWIGRGDFAQFYGTEQQGFAISGFGHVTLTENHDIEVGLWDFTGAAFLTDLKTTPPQPPISEWHGFLTGMAVNCQFPEEHSVVMNRSTDNFHYWINRETGTLAGNMTTFYIDTVPDASEDSAAFTNLPIGGELPSAYVSDDLLVSMVGCQEESTCQQLMDLQGKMLQPEGNFLITARPDRQAKSNYLKWGYWGIAYTEHSADPASPESSYTVSGPGALWLAGERTSPSYVKELIQRGDFWGEFRGSAQGVHVDQHGNMSELTNGTSHFMVDFNPASAEPVAGSINFDQKQLAVDGVNSHILENGMGFSAPIQDATAGAGIHGGFFGPDANAVGGNFDAQFDSDRYLGIFEGSLPDDSAIRD